MVLMRYHITMAKMQSKEDIGMTRFLDRGFIDLPIFEGLLSEKYISRRQHPSAPLWIWNYTQRTQFDSYWTRETIMSRGLITDFSGQIVARPFNKFWNWEEHQGPLPAGPYEVWEKLDGSLGILYWVDGQPCIATRGSFESEQAQAATEMLREDYSSYLSGLDPEFTHLFEIIYPENRIVVDYHGDRKLVYLGARHTAEGWDLSPSPESWPHRPDFFSTLDSATNPLDLKLLAQSNKEGFVLRFLGSGLRLKLKFDEYVRLHKVMTGLSAKDIWSAMAQGGRPAVHQMMELVPDEFYSEVKKVMDGLETSALAIETQCLADFQWVPSGDRRMAAQYISSKSNSHVLFAMLDGKDYKQKIWDLIKPSGARSLWKTNEETEQLSIER